jgi:hypothetical protein
MKEFCAKFQHISMRQAAGQAIWSQVVKRDVENDITKLVEHKRHAQVE